MSNAWDSQSAKQLYGFSQWSDGYFDLDESGQTLVQPHGDQGPKIALNTIVDHALAGGARLPLLLRFVDVLGDRVKRLTQAFDRAISERQYTNGYTAVYPIKVNQRISVVEELVAQGGDRLGLEAGSKPELMAVLAMSEQPDGLVICNGYKDAEYIRLALLGRQLGLRTVLVVEKLSELKLILAESKSLGVTPVLGVRLRLSSLGKGKWQNTGGEKAKFGLSARQLVSLVDQLKAEDLIGALQLLHFHMGSQISHVRDLQRGLTEAARHLAVFADLGVRFRYLDVGGGLGVDYEGSGSRGYFSMNYGLSQYAIHVVEAVANVCEQADLPMPHLITESGRAMTAHHAVLVTNVSAVEYVPEEEPALAGEKEHALVEGMRHLFAEMDQRSSTEAYHEADYLLSEGQTLFVHGLLNLSERAVLDELFFAICRKLEQRLANRQLNRLRQQLLDELRYRLSDKLFCNFSVFRSTPDVWAIDQVFPIAPLQRLNERPTRSAVIEDLTCDSDGRIDQYVQDGTLETTLPVHRIQPEEESYRLAFYMVGAYQETLGDIHNLFGRPDAVDVRCQSNGEWSIIRWEEGNTAAQLLAEVGYQPEVLMQRLQARVEAQAGAGSDIADAISMHLHKGLNGYTYLD
jgi:arginine decarboxylase